MAMNAAQEKPFASVLFADGKAAVVPHIWFVKGQNRKLCYWPKGKSQLILKDYIFKKKKPLASWEVYSVTEVLGFGCKYFLAYFY